MNSCKELVAAADVVLVVVGTDDQVKECFKSDEGLLKGPANGKIFIIVSTIHPRNLQIVTSAAGKRGANVLDAPVCWGEKGAIQGRLVSYVGGDRQSFTKCEDIFRAYSKEVFYLGPLGSGLIAKTTNNHLMWICRFANFEALILASRNYKGDVRILYRALLAGTCSNRCLERLSAGGDIPWARKDIKIVLAMARKTGASVNFARVALKAVKDLDLVEFNRKGLDWLEAGK